ncbi:MAG: DUF362 domain-containing protein [Proteobacteria bacterium]|nr:DUF362 domain-containing protein [Pseudomonadota bacterium]
MPSRVLILDAPSYQDVSGPITRALQELPGDFKGKKVLVKPNILGAHAPEKGVDTHPAIVREVVKQLQAQGAEVWVGDNSGVGGYGANERSAKASGIMEAASGCYRNIAQSGKEIAFKSRFGDKLIVSREVLEADLVISLPKFKTHALTVLTGAVKNTFGYAVGGEKSRLHLRAATFNDFGEAVVDVFQVRPPDLSIMDGVVAMEGYGPNNGTLRKVGKLLVSRDAVALDRVMAEMAGAPVEEIPFLKVAGDRKLGETDLKRIEIEGKLDRIPDFRLPISPAIVSIGQMVNRFLYPFIRIRPQVDAKLCTACGDCKKACPAGAITIDKTARIDKNKCIICYCCNEACTYQAISIKGHVRRLLSFGQEMLNRRL